MWPLISKEDTIHIEYKNFSDLRIGDIILYKNSEFVLHRINKINDKGLITKGDNNNKYDPIIVKEFNYFGVLTKIEKVRIKIIIKQAFLEFYFKYILIFHPIIKRILKGKN